MKVLMLSWEYPPKIFGGLGQHVFDPSCHLAKNNVDVHVITPRLNESPDYEESHGVKIHRAGDPHQSARDFKAWTFHFNGAAIRTAVRIMDGAEPFDVVHAHDWLAAYAGRSLASTYEIPLATTIHATEQGRSLGLHNRFQREIDEVEKNLALEAGLIICCSRFMADEIGQQFGAYPLSEFESSLTELMLNSCAAFPARAAWRRTKAFEPWFSWAAWSTRKGLNSSWMLFFRFTVDYR